MATETATAKRESISTKTNEEWLQLRTRDITSTESAALFGLSPYMTAFELWHRKKGGNVVEIDPSERMKWGTRLQDSIAAGIAADQKWIIEKRTQYERLPDQRIGASFDFTILGGQDGNGLLEIKNVDPLALRDEWIIEEEEIEAPPHIELQVQHQLMVSGLSYAYIGALVGGNRSVLIRRSPAPGIFDSIAERVEDFWKSIETGKEPNPDFARDSEFIAKLYRESKPGRIYDATKDDEIAQMAADYKKHAAVRDEAEKARDEIKARILMKIGDAEKVIGKGYSISTGTVKATRVEAFDRAAYRGFRVNVSKSK